MRIYTRADLTGQRFERWVVKELDISNTKKVLYWICECSCGTIKPVKGDSLKTGKSRSCGCLQKEIAATLSKKIRQLDEGIAFGNSIYSRYRKSSIICGREFLLTQEELIILIKQNCYYCGEIPSMDNHPTIRNGYNGSFPVNGIDRKDNNIGYILENCVPCCWSCNKVKGNLTLEDMSRINKIYTRLKLEGL